jgi:hypothetical protein
MQHSFPSGAIKPASEVVHIKNQIETTSSNRKSTHTTHMPTCTYNAETMFYGK